METGLSGDEKEESRPVMYFVFEKFLLLISAGRAAALTNRGRH